MWGAPVRGRGGNGAAAEREGAGGLLLAAAATETRLVTTLAPALPTGLSHTTPVSRRQLLGTLLFLGAVGLRRLWDLRGYAGDALALLTGRRRAYGYRHAERFLAQLARAGGAERLTDALACWTGRLWVPRLRLVEEPAPAFYIDGHHKAVYADHLIPRGLVARRGVVLGCRALVLLHDAGGHPLLAATHRGDLHLTIGLPQIIDRFEAAVGLRQVERVIVDREGMAAAFLAELAAAGRTVVTVLKADQYAGLGAFADVGAFMPLQHDRAGQVVREVAPARFGLPLPGHPTRRLAVSVALVRELRQQVPRSAPEASEPSAWDADLQGAAACWWQAGWVATPTPGPPTEPKLIPIVTTGPVDDPTELARAYFHRWPAQENVIKAWLLPLGLDTNHGYAKTPSVNSEVAKRRAALERRLSRLQEWAEQARHRSARAQRRADRLRPCAKARADALYRALNHQIWAWEAQGVPEHQLRAETKALQRAADAEIDQLWGRVEQARRTGDAEFRKVERYCQEQRALLRALADLAASERTMYELDNAKDQVMTVCKVALVNLVMWARDQYFPASYAHATWARLAPFFRLPGRLVARADQVYVELRPFNDRQLNRDLATLCARVAAAHPQLPDGRRLVLAVRGATSATLDAQDRLVA